MKSAKLVILEAASIGLVCGGLVLLYQWNKANFQKDLEQAYERHEAQCQQWQLEDPKGCLSDRLVSCARISDELSLMRADKVVGVGSAQSRPGGNAEQPAREGTGASAHGSADIRLLDREGEHAAGHK